MIISLLWFEHIAVLVENDWCMEMERGCDSFVKPVLRNPPPWESPPLDGMTMNVDAACKNGAVALAVLARDEAVTAKDLRFQKQEAKAAEAMATLEVCQVVVVMHFSKILIENDYESVVDAILDFN